MEVAPMRRDSLENPAGAGGLELAVEAGRVIGLLSDWTAETRGAKYD
jgi:hypothetical protein